MRARGRAPAKCRDGHSEACANERRIGLNEGRERPGCDPPVGDPRLVFSARSISARKLGLSEGRERPGCDPPVGDLRLIFSARLISARKLGLNEGRERPGCDPPVGDPRLIFWAHSEAMAHRDLARPRLGQPER